MTLGREDLIEDKEKKLRKKRKFPFAGIIKNTKNVRLIQISVFDYENDSWLPYVIFVHRADLELFLKGNIGKAKLFRFPEGRK